ncbi:MAG: replicase [Calystegia geminivirus 1]|nr:MAG: replicase [Calystegia geminivirus 1]
MAAPNRFRINSKNYFLTYPKCSLSKEDALEALKNLPYPTNLKYARVCHQIGEPHHLLRVLLQFQANFSCTNQKFFDLQHPTRTSTFHSIIQSANSSHVKSFIEKDVDYSEWGELQVHGRSRGGIYAEALKAPSKEAALQIIKGKNPKLFILQFHNLNAKLDRIFTPPPALFVSQWNPSSFRVPSTIADWIASSIFAGDNAAARPERPRSIIIEGPTRIGKTEWARSLGPHNYLAGDLDFNSRVFRNDVAYNVIDNVAPSSLKLKHWKELIGAKRDWQGNCRYQIKGGIPAIVLCNPGKGQSYKDFLDEEENHGLKDWTIQNAQFEFITEKMYNDE